MTSLPSKQPPPMPSPAYNDSLPISSIDAFQAYRTGGAYAYGNPAGGRAYISWGNPAYCDPSPDEHVDGGFQHHGMYYTTQPDPRCLPSYQSTPAASKPLAPYVDAESAAYSYGPQSTSIPAATTLAHRPAPGMDAASGIWYHNVAAGMSSPSGNNKVSIPPVVGRGQDTGLPTPCGRNDSVSSGTVYSKSSSSPPSSLPDMTSTSSCGSGSYESSPVSSYPPGLPPNQHLPPISCPGDMYPATTSTTSTATISPTSDFPPPPTNSYVYTDASAAAGIAIRCGSTGSPGNGSHAYTTSYGVPDGLNNGLNNVERKSAAALQS